MIKYDFWYNDTIEDIARINCFFNDATATYTGWIYNKDNKMIGDYTTTDSVELEKTFPGIFG